MANILEIMGNDKDSNEIFEHCLKKNYAGSRGTLKYAGFITSQTLYN